MSPRNISGVTGSNTVADFKLIYERNIFDPNRRPIREGRRPIPRRVEGFSLVGTMIYDKASYAFFNGSDARYRTTVALSNSIAGMKLTEIAPNSVKLSAESNVFNLNMEKNLRREDEGAWIMADGAGSWEVPAAVVMAEPSSSERDRFGGRDNSSGRDRFSGQGQDNFSGRNNFGGRNDFGGGGRGGPGGRDQTGGQGRNRGFGGNQGSGMTFSSGDTSFGGGSSPGGTSSGGSAAEILQRLMQRRAQEMGTSTETPAPGGTPAAIPASPDTGPGITPGDGGGARVPNNADPGSN